MALFRDDNDKQYQMLVAENRFVSDIQVAIEQSLKLKGISQADLARALDISEARVSQLLASNGKNLQARTIARIAHVLGMRAIIDFNSPSDAVAKSNSRVTGDFADWIRSIQETKRPTWDTACNDDHEFEEMDRQVA